MIIVTGATGQLGRGVVDALLARLPAGDIAASVRDPAKATDLAKRSVAVRRGDFADLASLATAFAGADQLLLISADKLGEKALRLHRSAIAAARESGVRGILYTSHMGARHGSLFLPANQRARTPASPHGGRSAGERRALHPAAPRLLRRELPADGRRRAQGWRAARA